MPSLDFRFHELLHVRMNHAGGPFMGPLLRRYAHYLAPPGGEPDLTFNFGPFTPDRRGARRLDGYYHVKEGCVGCDHRYKVARWTVEAKGLDGDRTVVNIDANLPGRVVMGGDTVPAFIRFQLARKGSLLIHGSAVEKDGQALIFAGRSGAGKTITAARLLRSGYRFLGDDCSILNPSGVYGFIQPFNVRFTYDVESIFGNPFTARDRIAIGSKRLLSWLTAGRINLLTSLPPERMVGSTLGDRGACRRFVLLQGGAEFRIQDRYPLEAAVEQTMLNLGFESRELDAYLLAYAHVFPGSPLAGFRARQAEILRASLAGKRIMKVTVPREYTEEAFRSILESIESA